MDLGAYAKIEELEGLLIKNGINIPRLRGLRLMKTEDKYDYNDDIKSAKLSTAEYMVRAVPTFSLNPYSYESSSYTDFLCDYYLVKNPDRHCKWYERHIGIRWDRIHGKNRRNLKFEIKKKKRSIKKQWDMWNKYCGKEDVLYVHCRCGGGNWPYYGEQIVSQPGYLEHCFDSFDGTYCDVYFSLK